MKIAGIIIAVVGALFTLVALSLGVTKYNLRSEDEFLQFLGGVVGWAIVSLVGVVLFVVGVVRSKNKTP